MSNFIPNLRFETEFEGDKVSVTLKPLTRATYMRMVNINVETKDKSFTEKGAALIDSASEILHEHIVEVTGLRDANGDAVSVDTMLESIYFRELNLEIYGFLVEGSNLGKLKSIELDMRSPENSTEAEA